VVFEEAAKVAGAPSLRGGPLIKNACPAVTVYVYPITADTSAVRAAVLSMREKTAAAGGGGGSSGSGTDFEFKGKSRSEVSGAKELAAQEAEKHKRELLQLFSAGSVVEIRGVDDGFVGSWYAARVLEVHSIA
jgi:hypothetical protein